MNAALSIVSWHPLLTDHQSHTLEALAAASGLPITVMVAELENPTRKAQGWTRPDTGALDLRLLGPKSGVWGIVRALRSLRDSVHVFGSPFDRPRFIFALGCALWMGLPVYLISEPYSTVATGYLDDRRKLVAWAKSKLRPWLYRFYGVAMRRRVAGVFAISPLAAAQYRAIGVPGSKIHPFGYFVPSMPLAAPRADPLDDTGRCNAVFVGNLIAIKGLTELVAALARLRAEGVALHVDVYGAGDPAAFDFDAATMRHVGTIPFGHAQSVIARYDFLVLPSRYDGWGVVVNEAIQAGVPVVCSDRVGAGSLVTTWHCGRVYAADTPLGLDNALRELASSPALRDRLRQACRAARPRLEPAVAGRYMADVIGSRGRPPPADPWVDR